MINLSVILCLSSAVFAQVSATIVPCGVPTVQHAAKRIVGGKVAKPGAWPWTVLLTDDLGYITGGGAIINPSVILTSAQIFDGIPDSKLYLWRIYAGEYNISTTDPYEKFYIIQRLIVHPRYNATTLENDIALLIVNDGSLQKGPIVYNAHTRPACLPDNQHTYAVGDACYLAGWGSTQQTGDENIMNQIHLPILNDSVCQQHFPGYLPNTEMCAGYENGHKDWCPDDLGDPLMCKSSSNVWYVQGLASSGGRCKLADEPSVFEDVGMYTNWIKATMALANHPYEY